MAKTAADQFAESLRVYGVVGDSLNGLTDSLRRQAKIEWMHVRHEEVAAFAAGAEVLAHDGLVLIDAVVARTELAMPPAITVEMTKGFTLYMIKAVMSGRLDEIVDLAVHRTCTQNRREVMRRRQQAAHLHVPVPVRIHIDQVPDGVLLVAGITATVQIDPQPKPSSR
jgi:hypothetical protein